MKKIKVRKISLKETIGRLNIFNIEYLTKSGKERTWNIVSRNGEEKFKKRFEEVSPKTADGVCICAIHKETGKIVLLKEYRVGVNSDLITFPGGVINEGEDLTDTAKREFKEETNMELINISKVGKPRYSAVGITDEAITLVYGVCTGNPTDMQGDNEEGKVLLLSPKEVEDLLNENTIAFGGRTELLLENYLLHSKLNKK